MTTPEGPWDLSQALNTYQFHRWGDGYFDVNAKGNVSIRPVQEQGAEIDIMEVIEDARERGLKFPMLLRFQDLLRHRVQRHNAAFAEAIKEEGYQGI